MLRSSETHTNKKDKTKNLCVELLTKSNLYPCVLLKPNGHVICSETVTGMFPAQTAFYFESITQVFHEIKKQFEELPEGDELDFSCGCHIRKLTQDEIIELCRQEWYPFVWGEPNLL